MFRVDTTTAAVGLPAFGAPGTPGYFQPGDPTIGQPATIPGADWFNDKQEEMMAVLAAAGIAPAKGTTNQLLTAIKTLIEIQHGNYALDTGAANAYVIALDPAVGAYADGMPFRFRIVHPNTGASTLDAGAGARALVNSNGGALVSGDLGAGALVAGYYDQPSNSMIIETIVASQLSLITATSQVLWGGTSAGTANAQTMNASPVPASYTAPFLVLWVAGAGLTNTAAMTLNFNGLGVKNHFKRTPGGPIAMTGGEVGAGNLNLSMYDGTQFQHLIGLPVGQSLGGAFRKLKATNGGTPNNQITTTADALVVEDANGNAIKLLNVNVTSDVTTGGVNGLDTGAVAANTDYYKWVIYNPSTQTAAGLLSLSATAPTMPAGYTHKALVSWNHTDGSSRFARFIQYGRDWDYLVTGAAPTAAMPLLASGAAGTPSTGVYVPISLAGIVPGIASAINVSAQSAGAPAIILVAPNNNYGVYASGTNPPPINMSPSSGSILLCCMARMALESTNIYYAATGAGSSLWCKGFTLNL